MAEQKQNASGGLPKNIRQIGTSTGSTRVYLEDYVYTYLHVQEEPEEWLHRGFVLLGRMEGSRDCIRYFISGMIRLKDSFFQNDILEFADGTWAFIFQEMKKYYEDLEIVGWGQDVSGAPAGMTAEIERVHKQNFNIQKNVLFLLDKVENEEAFYVFEKNMLQRREGYYVYYEKNPQMQEYMIGNHKSQELNISPEDIKEPLVHSYREILMDKKARAADRKWNGVLYAASMILVLSVCVLGVSTVNNVEKMKNLELAVSRISDGDGQAGVSAAMSQNVQDADGTGHKNDTSDSETSDSDTADPEEAASIDTDSDESKDGAGSAGSDESKDGAGAAENAGGSGGDDQADESKDSSGAAAEDEKPAETSGKAEKTSDSPEADTLTEAQTYLLQGYYIVKKGDSLVGISKKIYGTPKKADKIRTLNGIEDMDKIYAGQRLELP